MTIFYEETNKLKQCLFGIVLTIMILSPLFCEMAYIKYQLVNKSVITDGTSKLFISPQQSWFFVKQGIFFNISVLFLLILCIVNVHKKVSDFNFKIWLAIVVFGWIGTIIIGVDTFNENKGNYVLIAPDVIECRLKNKKDIIPVSQITKVFYEEKAFIICYIDKGQNILVQRALRYGTNKRCRISNVMVKNLCGGDILRQELDLLLSKYNEH